MIPWSAITQLGDLSVMAPSALFIAALLLAGRSYALALRWMALFGGAMLLVMASKLAFAGWGIGLFSLDFTGISGHAVCAMAVLPTTFHLALLGQRRALYLSGLTLGVALGLLVCISRLMLQAHTPSEVIAGAVLGLAVAGGFAHSAHGAALVPQGRAGFMGAAALAIFLAIFTQAAPTQRWVVALADYLAGTAQPHVRKAPPRAPRKLAPMHAPIGQPEQAKSAMPAGAIDLAKSQAQKKGP